MSLYKNYLSEIENRKKEGLKPKPIEDGALLTEIIYQIKDENNPHRRDSLNFLIYNTIPGTTTAAVVKSKFLKEIITKQIVVKEIETTNKSYNPIKDKESFLVRIFRGRVDRI